MLTRNFFVLLLVAACLGCADGNPPQVDSTSIATNSLNHAFAPNLTIRADGTAILTALRIIQGGHEFIALDLDADSTKPTVVAEGLSFFANWADVPGLVEAGDGSLIAHWLQQTGPATYDYGVRLAQSTDGGATWTPLGWLNDDAWSVSEDEVISGEHGFVAWVPEGDGARAFWLDGRAAAGHDGMAGAMQLRTTTVVDGEVAPSELLDDRVCDCCPNAAVQTPNGPLVAFRDRTEDEIRDVHILHQTGDGWQRTAVDTSGWQIPGCPVNGPALAAAGDLVLVAWYTAHPEPRVYAAWSEDGGLSFGEPVLLTTDTLGRVTGAILDGVGYVAWLSALDSPIEDEMPPGEVRMVRMGSDGHVGSPVTVAETAATRRVGIPRLVVAGDELGLAWTEAEKRLGEESATSVAYRRVDVGKHAD